MWQNIHPSTTWLYEDTCATVKSKRHLCGKHLLEVPFQGLVRWVNRVKFLSPMKTLSVWSPEDRWKERPDCDIVLGLPVCCCMHAAVFPKESGWDLFRRNPERATWRVNAELCRSLKGSVRDQDHFKQECDTCSQRQREMLWDIWIYHTLTLPRLPMKAISEIMVWRTAWLTRIGLENP